MNETSTDPHDNPLAKGAQARGDGQGIAVGAVPTERIEFGVMTFAETVPPGRGSVQVSCHERLQQVLAEARLADRAGLDIYGVGEHHRHDFAASAPAVILAAIAAHTSSIRLSSATTVLACTDPVRVFQDFSTLDLLSSGRAELIVGRGSFPEPYPLFGVDPAETDPVFGEKLDLLRQIRDHEFIEWTGRHRPPLTGQGVYPRPYQDRLPLWVAVSHNTHTARRAAVSGLPMILGLFAEDHHLHHLCETYRDHSTAAPRIAAQLQGLLADSAGEASRTFYRAYTSARRQTHPDAPPLTPAQFTHLCRPNGPLAVGTLDEVSAKITHLHHEFGITRFLLHISVGYLPHDVVLRAIELWAQLAHHVRTDIEIHAK
ncbi:LLM class flavin-dependent oxidoreductase [Nocardia sp. NPDC088792]|uniref:LLM class flavin-dependent oxidoreductase n=1 Tax=Nocardia sp. NPDC088792 TaxID=3364332 RepID=UPI003829CDA4